MDLDFGLGLIRNDYWHFWVDSRDAIASKNRVKIYLYFYCLLLRPTSVYLDVVEEVHEDLHDTGEDHHAGAVDEEGVDVVKWLILLCFGYWYKLQDGMSGSDLVA